MSLGGTQGLDGERGWMGAGRVSSGFDHLCSSMGNILRCSSIGVLLYLFVEAAVLLLVFASALVGQTSALAG